MSATTQLDETNYQPSVEPRKSAWLKTLGLWLAALPDQPGLQTNDEDVNDPRNTSLFFLLPPI